ncbi:phage antirepressor [Pseudomonas taiwanensis]|uniref:BRO-N domain-containing protein n=1 Tax=Pseudomonas taiwanensis TaxID=470150 RepID=UPI0015BFC85F|nr:Bro-N domain-containing protein [Pseudomonas taiwanensis]NWL76100.1 phage antirepressor [Pseudomonas taiwanensis]
MTDYRTPTRFQRFRLPLRALLIDDRAWFVSRDLAKLASIRTDTDFTRKLDEDQLRDELILLEDGGFSLERLVNESGLHQLLLVHYYHPEHRGLRRWITDEVVPGLGREHAQSQQPRRRLMNWQGQPLNLMEWQGTLWIRYEDMPRFQGQVPERKALL